jgi:hypothetical protein
MLVRLMAMGYFGSCPNFCGGQYLEGSGCRVQGSGVSDLKVYGRGTGSEVRVWGFKV